jgi:hypothetical protein
MIATAALTKLANDKPFDKQSTTISTIVIISSNP